MAAVETIDSTGLQTAVVPVQDARSIQALGHKEAFSMAKAELSRFLQLVEALNGEEGELPTPCSRWNVRQMIAHQAGSNAAFASFNELRRQHSSKVQRPYRRLGLADNDAANQIQVDERKDVPLPELIAELKKIAPVAIEKRYRLPLPLRMLHLPIPSVGFARLDYLTDTILIRDIWMHRVDICDATGRVFTQDPEHDARIVALVVRDLASNLKRTLGGRAVIYDLTGPAGGTWRVGRNSNPAAVIHMDAIDFNRIASGRISAEDVLIRNLARIEGDANLAKSALHATTVAY